MRSWFSTVKQALTRPLGLNPRERENTGKLRDQLKCLYPPVRNHWRTGAVSALAASLAALITLAQPLINCQFIDRVLLGRELSLLPLFLLLTGGLGVTSLALGTLKDWYATKFEEGVGSELQERLYDHFLKLPKIFFERKDTGDLLAQVRGDVGGLNCFYSMNLVHSAVQVLRFIGGLALLFSFDWRLTLLVLACLPVSPAAVYFLSRRIGALGEADRELRAPSNGGSGGSITALALLKSCTAEKRILRQLSSARRTSSERQLEQSSLSHLTRVATHMGPAVAQLAVLCIGACWVVKGSWTLGALVAFQSYLGCLFGPSQALAAVGAPFQKARVALGRVHRFFQLVPEENYDRGKRVSRLLGKVEFRDVSFSYDGAIPVVEHLNCRIEPGEHVAIVGPSGIGKTTLISLILLFYRPTSGEILFDGEPASVYEVQSLRRRIGYMPQTTMLLPMSILENVRYGNPDATPEEALRACTIAGIGPFFQGLPEGLRTVVGSSGMNLSEGQAQRLSLARALVKDPDILLLDEPTSAVDLVTERSIFESLPAVIEGKTLFIVAHRLSTIKDCSRILLFDENHFVASGTHDSLLRTSEYYRLLMEIHCSPALPAGRGSRAAENPWTAPPARGEVGDGRGVQAFAPPPA